MESITDIKTRLNDIAENISVNSMGLSTNLPSLDEKLCGLQNDELIVVAGRSSMGKSSWMIGAALEISKEKNVVLFSLEMSFKIIVERMLVNLAKVNYHNIKLGYCSNQDKEKITKAKEILDNRKIFVDDSSYLSPSFINKKLTEFGEKSGCIMIDYLQLMSPTKPTGNLTQDLDNITKELKSIAKMYHIPVVLLSQLNRQPDQRENHIPRLCDLRSSGGIEQNADAVILIHRPNYYKQQEGGNFGEGDDGESHFIIGKNRQGPTGVTKAVWISESMQFVPINWREF